MRPRQRQERIFLYSSSHALFRWVLRYVAIIVDIEAGRNPMPATRGLRLTAPWRWHAGSCRRAAGDCRQGAARAGRRLPSHHVPVTVGTSHSLLAAMTGQSKRPLGQHVSLPLGCRLPESGGRPVRATPDVPADAEPLPETTWPVWS